MAIWGALDKFSTSYFKNHPDYANVYPNNIHASSARLSAAGLVRGGTRPSAKKAETRVGFALAPPNGKPVRIQDDWRVRISLSENSNILYLGEAGILTPLRITNGVVFPYTPSITTNYTASYGTQKPTHANYPMATYEASEVQAVQISGDFTVQSLEEGQYLLACIYFFRACTKMFYGNGPLAGNPPPMVFLNGYGSHYFPNVPCVVTSFQHVMGNDVDYIEIPIGTKDIGAAEDSGAVGLNGNTSGGKGQTTRLPTTSQIQVGLQPLYSRKRVSEFDLEKFARGDLLDKGFL